MPQIIFYLFTMMLTSFTGHVVAEEAQTIKEADGTVIEVQADGSKKITKTDGTKIEIKADGTKVIQKPDGSSVEVKPSKQF